jgi:PPM family protein phosphatase
VLGDVDATPEIDTAVQDVRPGDRWLLCSDGLSSYVADEKIHAVLEAASDAQSAAERLVEESLSVGAPDNVTIVVVDIDETDDSSTDPPTIVGSAAGPLSFEGDASRRSLRLPTLLLHPLKVTLQEDSHFEPESDEYLDELIEEDRRRAVRRRISWLIGIGLAIAAIVIALMLGYRWTQSHYYVGADGESVAIFQGVQQNLGPISLHSVHEESSLRLSDLPAYWRESVVNTISADDLADAQAILDRLMDASNG